MVEKDSENALCADKEALEGLTNVGLKFLKAVEKQVNAGIEKGVFNEAVKQKVKDTEKRVKAIKRRLKL